LCLPPFSSWHFIMSSRERKIFFSKVQEDLHE
jgi:hypothetical protein